MIEHIEKGVSISGRERAELRKELKRLYESGSSIRDLCDATGRSYGFIHRMLTEAGVEFRSRGGPRLQRRDEVRSQ